jgi:pilus assembly protein CpaB
VRNWRVLTAAVAAVAAVLAAVGVYFYLNKADQRAQSKLDQVSVLVASQPIPAGTSGSTAQQNGWLTYKKVARKDIPPGTLTSTSGLDSLVAAYQITNGGYITPGSFVESSQVGDFANTLGKGMEATSISVDPQHGVAGLISPGDKVSVVISLRIIPKANKNSGNSSTENTGDMTTAYLLKGIKVLAVGSTTANTPVAQPSSAVPTGANTTPTTQPASAGNRGLITLEVTPRQAEQIAHAYAIQGVVYVTLDNATFNPNSFHEPGPIVEANNLFDAK